MKMSTTLAATALTIALALPVQGAPLLFDSFESGNMSATNAAGFSWGSNNRTSVVTSEAAVYNNREIYNPPSYDADWTPKHGDHSLRFRYAAGEPMAEQRFDLGGAYKDLWIQYWVRVPTNYSHGQSSPSNHKFFALWMDDYSSKGLGPTIAWEFWGTGGGSSGLAYHYSEGQYTILGGHRDQRDFISVPEDQGRWMEITIHTKASSNDRSADGVIELWRRWEDEASNQRTLFHRTTNAILPIPNGGPEGWSAGYFMGWANAAYAQDTEWLVDYITFSTESLLDSSDFPSDESAPRPPVLTID